MAELELTSVRCLMTTDLLCRDGVRLRVAGDDRSGIELSRTLEEGYARRLGERVSFQDSVTIELIGYGGEGDELAGRQVDVPDVRRNPSVDRLVLLPEALVELPVGAHARVARFRGGSSTYRLDLVLHVRPADLQRWEGRRRPYASLLGYAAS